MDPQFRNAVELSVGVEGSRSTNEGRNEPQPLLNGLALHREPAKSQEEERAERRLILKIDLLILPLLITIFFFSSLDRGDLSYAYVAGLKQELKMDAHQLSNDISLLYLGYIMFDLPATLILKRVTANLQLGTALIAWGAFTTLMSICNSWQQIGGLRILIGCGEAFIQAAYLYLTFFYKREELATRGGILYSMVAVSGSANGLIAYVLLKNMNGVRGWLAWRWMFLIEGLMSVGWGLVVLLLLPASPENLRWFFNAQEKEIALRRYREAFNIERTRVSSQIILKTLKDPKTWFYTVIYMATNFGLGAFGNFLPVMLKDFGYSALHTNLLVVPIWVCSGTFTIITCIISDHIKKRGIMILICFATAGIGWIILLVCKSQWVKFVGTMVIGSGTLPQVVLCLVWMNSNMLSYTKRATTLAIILMLGQCVSIASAQIYTDVPLYKRGDIISLSSMIVGFIITAVFMHRLSQLNAKKVALQDLEEAVAQRGRTIEEVQDMHPDFFYYL